MEYLEQTAHIPKEVLVTSHPNPADPRFVDFALSELEKLSKRLSFGLMVAESPRNESEARQLLLESSSSDHIILGGDGVNHNIYSALYEIKPDIARMNPLGGGGACDLARQVHPFINSYFIRRALSSPSLPHRPLLVTAEHPEINAPDNKIETIAMVYWALGFTAKMGTIFNSNEFREKVSSKNPKVRKAYQVNEILKNLKTNDTLIIEHEDEEPDMVNEYVFPNGNRMAGGLVRFSGNSTFKDQFGEMAVGPISFPTFFKSLGKAVLGLYDKHQLGEVVRFTASSLDESPLAYQADGETGVIPSGSLITIKLGEPRIEIVTSNPYHRQIDKAA